jgi:hypothetical protein
MSLTQLLQDNSKEIDKLAQLLQDSSKDRVWLLRYILSNKTAQDSQEACRYAIKWNQDHIDDIRLIENGGEHPLKRIISQFQVADEHKTTITGEPVFYVRIGLCNTKGLMDAISYEDVLYYFTISRVKALKQCDELSRKQDRIVKTITVLDFQGFSLTRGNDSRFRSIIGESSKVNEKLYPQLVGNTIFVNIPSIFYWTVNLTKPLLSKRAAEKLIFCPGVQSKKSIAECPYVSRMFNIDDIPTFIGGKCSCPGGCIGNIPNSQSAPVNEVTADGLSAITISARSTEKIEVPIPAGVKINYAIRVESRKIEIQSDFTAIDNSKTIALIQKRFLNAEEGELNGQFNATEPGNLIFLFDNTHSLLRSKVIQYKIEFQ